VGIVLRDQYGDPTAAGRRTGFAVGIVLILACGIGFGRMTAMPTASPSTTRMTTPAAQSATTAPPLSVPASGTAPDTRGGAITAATEADCTLGGPLVISPARYQAAISALLIPAKVADAVSLAELTGAFEWDYTPERLAMLSRWAHKMALESFAWSLGVGDTTPPPGTNVDLFHHRFDAVRAWARRGEPQGTIRPVLRKLPETRPASIANPTVGTKFWLLEDDIVFEVSVFGDRYVCALTTDHHHALDMAKACVLGNWEHQDDIWIIGDTFQKLT